MVTPAPPRRGQAVQAIATHWSYQAAPRAMLTAWGAAVGPCDTGAFAGAPCAKSEASYTQVGRHQTESAASFLQCGAQAAALVYSGSGGS